MAGRLTIIGGGVMGLMTAYYAAPLAEAVTVLDRSRVGDPATASFGLTRSFRNDYRDPEASTPGSAGTAPGTKFAPWVGRVVAQLAMQQGTVYEHRALRADQVR
ncbi:MAG: FAD-dependent oxidoreductase [Streptosporangiaceae bacterium]